MKVSAMKKTGFGKTAVLALGLAVMTFGTVAVVPQPAQSQFLGGPLDWRRTLFAPFGQHTLHFEAPLGMCFLDETDPTEALAIKEIRMAIEKNSSQSLVAVFADCLQIAGIGQGGAEGGNDLGDIGLITWLNGKGEKIPVDKTTYFDGRAATFHNHTRAGLVKYARTTLDETVTRTAEGVALGFEADIEIAYSKLKTIGVASATSIRRFPVDFVITHTAKKPTKEKKELYELMDKFMQQQVALNAVE